MALPLVQLHPISYKLLRQGHPWVTLDAFSRRFPPDASFLRYVDAQSRSAGVLLHDPRHKEVRGRLWSRNPAWSESDFPRELHERLTRAREKRLAMPELKLREHCYWLFGEADDVPGLMLLQLGDQFILQIYALAWQGMMPLLENALLSVFPEITVAKLWLQVRSDHEAGQKPAQKWHGPTERTIYPVREDSFLINARLGEAYDYGLYTDMAAIRQELKALVAASSSVLNLYSYTGAFSLMALGLGAKEAISVDLSPKYLAWLEENLALNTFHGQHQSLKMPAEEALKKLAAQGKRFDLIISDPPSSSSDGQKRSSALQSYERQWEFLQPLLQPKGHLISFLNTHRVSTPKFEAQLKAIEGNRLKLERKVFLGADCPTLKGFHEGNYLKGLIWRAP